MRADSVGNELVAMLHEARFGIMSSVVIGLTLAFEFPEYAHALYVAADGQSRPDDHAITVDFLREWIETHPIEVVA